MPIQADGRVVDLSQLPELVRLEVLLGIQRAIKRGLKFGTYDMTWTINKLRQLGVSDARMLAVSGQKRSRAFLRTIHEATEDAFCSLDDELDRDVWRLRILFPAGQHTSASVSFEGVSQAWLRELTKRYCVTRLDSAPTTVRQVARRASRFSQFLAASASGESPDALDRFILDRYVSWIATTRTPRTYRAEVSTIGELLRFAHRRGHADPGGVAYGLPDAAVILEEDLRHRRGHEAVDDEPGRAIPEYVIAQLLDGDALARLTADMAALTTLLAHVGRRPAEICGLAADCLFYLEGVGDGQRRPVLRYRRSKPPVKYLHLPIHEETAALIREQQIRVQRRFPTLKLRDLKLFPRVARNPAGSHGMASQTLGTAMRRWVDDLPVLVDERGASFPRQAVFPYAFRHSYAQRHADSGTPLDVLQKLMDHRSPHTTQIYYRVRDERLHEAVKTVGPMTLTAAGERAAVAFPDADQLARGIGQIPVPLGHCVEPHNVKTLGSSCPFSHQCLGCTHFRTDPSYLPDLYIYLERLLEAQERLRATAPELAEWARTKALPNDEEIQAVRRLIRANTALLEELTTDERRHLEALFRVLRGERARTDDAIAVQHVAAVAQPEPTFEPARFTPLPAPQQKVS